MQHWRLSIVTTLALAAALPICASAQMRPPIPLSAGQFLAARPGSSAIAVVRIEGRKRGTLRAELLDRKDDASYLATGEQVELYLSDDAAFVMGTPGDMVPGAIVFVYGVVTAHARADVKKVIVVTTLVSVGAKPK